MHTMRTARIKFLHFFLIFFFDELVFNHSQWYENVQCGGIESEGEWIRDSWRLSFRWCALESPQRMVNTIILQIFADLISFSFYFFFFSLSFVFVAAAFHFAHWFSMIFFLCFNHSFGYIAWFTHSGMLIYMYETARIKEMRKKTNERSVWKIKLYFNVHYL